MNSEYKDFIGVFSDVYPEDFCEHLIAEFDRHREQTGKTGKAHQNTIKTIIKFALMVKI